MFSVNEQLRQYVNVVKQTVVLNDVRNGEIVPIFISSANMYVTFPMYARETIHKTKDLVYINVGE